MSDIIVERDIDPPLDVDQFSAMALAGQSCLALYRIDWIETYLSVDGRHLVCQFDAPDAETARTAIRQTGTDVTAAWPATFHMGSPVGKTANVMVARRFDEPVDIADIQALEDDNINCLNIRGVTFVKTLFSADCKRMLCLYQAPDAEAVRSAQREAGLPVEQVWACRRLTATDLQQA